MEKLLTTLPNDEWCMDSKVESLRTDGNSFLGLNGHHVCNGEPPGRAGTFLVVWRRLTLIKKIVHFSVSMLMFWTSEIEISFWNSERMVLLHLKHKILCSWFLSHHSYSDFIYHVIEIPTTYLKFEMQKLLKATLEFGNHFDKHHVQKLKGRRFRCLSLKWHEVKNTVKSLVRENKFHTCLTRETLPAEERVSRFHNHGKTPSYQTFADASIRKVVPKTYRSS